MEVQSLFLIERNGVFSIKLHRDLISARSRRHRDTLTDNCVPHIPEMQL